MTPRSVLAIVVALLVGIALGGALSPTSSSRGDADPAVQAADDPTAALESIISMESPRERARALVDLLDRTHPSSGLLVHEKLAELRTEPGMDEIVEILVAEWWADAAPQIAFVHPVDPLWPDRHPWARTVVEEWAEKDPVAAAIAVQNMPEGPNKGRKSAARAVLDSWLTLETMPDPKTLLGVVAQLEPMARSGALHHVAKTLIEHRGIDEALDVIRDMPDERTPGGSVQQELLARTGVALLDFDSDRAVAWAAEHAGAPAGPGIHKHIAYYWGVNEGRPALEWALDLPGSPSKAMIVKRAWISYSRKHRDDAADWLRSRQPHPEMKDAYRDFIRSLAETEAENALELAERAEDPDYRDDLLAAAAEGWMTVDPEAAQAWLAGSGLPPELTQRVRAAARKTRAPRSG